MKYMIMLYGSQRGYDAMAGKPVNGKTFAPEEFAPLYEYMGKLNNELIESGEFVDAQGLAAPVHTRRIELRDGAAVVTDGPYAETQEVLAGYTIVECESFDRATEIAKQHALGPVPEGAFAEAEFAVDVRLISGGPEGFEG